VSEPAARNPSESCVTVNGAELALFDWPGEGAPILFVHATGFHARCWDQVIAGVPGRHCIAVDLRGHGRSSKEPPYDWDALGRDIAALVQALDLGDTVAVGHSMGGFIVTVAAAAVPERFGRLLLVDPTIGRRDNYAPGRESGGVHFSARRRNRWSSAQEMFERFYGRPPFDTWDTAVLHDYCDYGLLPAPDGDGYVLACPPEIEGRMYTGGGGYDIYRDVAAVAQPVRVLRGRQREAGAQPEATPFRTSVTAPDLAARFRNGEDVLLPDLSHFIPMEAPALVARHVREVAGAG
jgi:lipase